PNDDADEEGTVQSGFDGDELLSQPGITLSTVDADVIRQAEARSTPCTAIPPQRFHSIGFSSMLPATSDRRRIAFSNRLRSVRTANERSFEKTLVWPLEDGDETAFGQG